MFIKKYNRCLRPTQIDLYALDGVSGPVHAPAELTPLHNEQEDGWGQQTVGTIQTVKKKKNILPPPGIIRIKRRGKTNSFLSIRSTLLVAMRSKTGVARNHHSITG